MKKLIKIVIISFILVFLISIVSLFTITSDTVLDIKSLSTKNSSITMLDTSDKVIPQLNLNKDIKYSEIPKYMSDAFIVMEDKRFYEHNGIDLRRIVGATINNIKSLKFKEGASTITQQLIKNTHLSSEKTISRKIKEMKLAMELEKILTKNEILEAYLNVIYFGNGIYGVSEAARNYFNKECYELTLSECAVIAGVVKNPSKYSPLINIENNLSRRNLILKEMLNDGKIKEKEYNNAINEIILTITDEDKNSTSYSDAVIDEACNILRIDDKELVGSNYKIYTYYDSYNQKLVENEIKNNIPTNDYLNKANGYGIIADNISGGITAYYNTSYFGSVLKRQPGSLLKPFLSYLPAIKYLNASPATPILDEKIVLDNYSPSNYNNSYCGWTNLRNAVAKSLNIPAVKLMSEVGVYSSIDYAENFGLNFIESDYTLASALGGLTEGCTANELIGAYMTLANDGFYTKPSFIRKIEDSRGRIIYERNTTKIKKESIENIFLMKDMLKSTAKIGTAKKLSKFKYDIASKTGTVGGKHGGNNDAWNMSFTSAHTVCTWIGNLQNNEENEIPNNVTGATIPTQIISNIFENLYSKNSPQNFNCPNGIIELNIDGNIYEKEHKLIEANKFCKKNETIKEFFKVGTIETNNDIAEIDNQKIDLNLKLIKERPYLSFEASAEYYYDIVRTKNNVKEIIATISDKNKKIVYIDKDVEAGDTCEYYVIPYFINYLNEKIALIESNRLIIIIPFYQDYNEYLGNIDEFLKK